MERYVIRGGREGYDRLAVLARAWWPTTSALFDRVGLGPGMRCLDLGCGGGAVTFEIARRVLPGGSVTGVDMDEVKLELARQAAVTAGLHTIDFRAVNAYDWSEPDSYDLVYCRFLLQHLSRPLDVLREMWSAVRRGGVVAVEDLDFDAQFSEPPSASLAFWVAAYDSVLRSYGGDPLIGRRLYALFAAAGIPVPELKIAQRVEVTSEAKLLPHLTLEATRDAIVEAGVATDDEVEPALAGLAALAGDGSTILGSPRLFQAWSRRASAG